MLTDILKKISSFKSVKLDATPVGLNVYKEFGFRAEFEILKMTNLSVANISVRNDQKIFAECIEPKLVREIIDFDENIWYKQIITYQISAIGISTKF